MCRHFALIYSLVSLVHPTFSLSYFWSSALSGFVSRSSPNRIPLSPLADSLQPEPCKCGYQSRPKGKGGRGGVGQGAMWVTRREKEIELQLKLRECPVSEAPFPPVSPIV